MLNGNGLAQYIMLKSFRIQEYVPNYMDGIYKTHIDINKVLHMLQQGVQGRS